MTDNLRDILHELYFLENTKFYKICTKQSVQKLMHLNSAKIINNDIIYYKYFQCKCIVIFINFPFAFRNVKFHLVCYRRFRQKALLHHLFPLLLIIAQFCWSAFKGAAFEEDRFVWKQSKTKIGSIKTNWYYFQSFWLKLMSVYFFGSKNQLNLVF